MSVWRSELHNTPNEAKFDEIGEFTTDNGILINDNIQGPELSKQQSLLMAGEILDICGDPRLLTICTEDPTGTIVDYSGKGHDGTPSDLVASDQEYKGLGYTYNFENSATAILDFGDHNDFSFGDGSNDSDFSLGALVYVSPTLSQHFILGKYSGTTIREYQLFLTSVRKFTFYLCDESANAEPNVESSATTVGWHYCVATYAGTGAGATAADRMNLYIDGLENVDSRNNKSYTAMENTSSIVSIGAEGTSTTRSFNKQIGLSFIDGSCWSAKQVWNSWMIIKSYYNL